MEESNKMEKSNLLNKPIRKRGDEVMKIWWGDDIRMRAISAQLRNQVWDGMNEHT